MYEYSYVCTLARITCDEKEHVMYGMPFQKYTMVRSTWYSYSYDIPGTPEYLVSYIHVSWLC